MNHLRNVIAAAVRDLKSAGGRFALVGGLAVSARAEPRTTRDVDLAVAVDSDEQAEAVIFALQSRGYLVLQTVEHEGTNRLATARLRPPAASEGGAVLDLLFASSGIEPELVEAADDIEILKGVVVPVAQIGHLIALKLLARDDVERPQDQLDLKALAREATPNELAQARQAIDLIAERGFQRGRDLEADFERFESAFSKT